MIPGPSINVLNFQGSVKVLEASGMNTVSAKYARLPHMSGIVWKMSDRLASNFMQKYMMPGIFQMRKIVPETLIMQAGHNTT